MRRVRPGWSILWPGLRRLSCHFERVFCRHLVVEIRVAEGAFDTSPSGGGRAGLRRCSGDDVGAGADGDEVAGVVVELHASDDEAVPDAQREPFCREGDPDSWA